MAAEQVGIPFEGEVHSADANAGVAIPIYLAGAATSTAYTLGADEYLEVTWAKLVTVAGGDSFIHIGPDASLGVNEAVVRGTYAANGGFAGQISPAKVGILAGTLFITSPAGVVDVQIGGFIRQLDSTGNRPSWREASFGQ